MSARCLQPYSALFGGRMVLGLSGLFRLQFFPFRLEPTFTTVLVGRDHRHAEIIANNCRHHAGDHAANEVGQEHVPKEVTQPVPISAVVGKDRFEVVPKILPSTFEPAAKLVFFLKTGAKQKVAQAQGDGSDRHEGDRVAKERGHNRCGNIAAHYFRDQSGGNEVQTKERGKADKHACEHPTRNFARAIWQAADPVFDIVKRPAPATLWPDQVQDP